MSSTRVASGSRSPATPSPPSTSWQKPWVVAIVAASKSASARASRARRASTTSRRPSASSRTTSSPEATAAAPARARPRPAARARGRAARRGHPREGHQQQLLQRRALGDVARRQRRDRVRLARPRARLEHGDARRQRAADVERRGSLRRVTRLVQPAARPTAGARSWPKRVGSPGSQRSSGARAARRAAPRTASAGRTTSSCSGSRSSFGKRSDSHSRARRSPPRRRSAADVGSERQRLAHPAVVEVDQHRELLQRVLALQRRSARDRDAAPEVRGARARPIVTAS